MGLSAPLHAPQHIISSSFLANRSLRFLGYLLLKIFRRIKQKETKVTKFLFGFPPELRSS